MWICTNTGFVSIVENHAKGFKDTLLVRARRREHLHEFFMRADIEDYVLHTEDSDYAYRVVCERETVKTALAAQVDRINYGNFKNSVSDPDLTRFYTEVWVSGFRNLSDQHKNVQVLAANGKSNGKKKR